MPCEPSAIHAFFADHVAMLCASYQRLTGSDLIVTDTNQLPAEALYPSPVRGALPWH